MKKDYFHITYREFYDATDNSFYPVCCAWIYDNKKVYPFTIACGAVNDIIKKLSPVDREMIVRAFARNMVGEFLNSIPNRINPVIPINAKDFLKETKYIFDALSDRQIEILRNIVITWNEYDRKQRGERK